MKPEQLKGHLDGLLLAIVEAGPAHGYAIVEALWKKSGGVFDLPEGTIYPALHRLERAGYLESRWSDAAGRQRRVYVLTPAGGLALAQARVDWEQFARGVRTVLLPGGT